MSAKSGKRLTAKQRRQRRAKLGRALPRQRNLKHTIVPPGLETLHKAVVGFICMTLYRRQFRRDLVVINPIIYKGTMAEISITIISRLDSKHKPVARESCLIRTFYTDFANPESFPALEAFLNCCADRVPGVP